MWFYWTIAMLGALGTKVSSFFLFNHCKKIIYVVLGILFAGLTICIFVVTGAIRDPYSVGTDSANYGITNFYDAINMSFNEFDNLSRLERYPTLCKLIFWIPAHLTNNQIIYFGTFSAITTIPVIIVCIIHLKQNSWMSVFIWGSMIYPVSFNSIRESMAVSIIFVGIYLLLKKRIIFYLLAQILAINIHTGAICALPILLIYWYFFKVKLLKKENLTIKLIISVIITSIIVYYSDPLIKLLLTDTFYERYTDDYTPPGYLLVSYYAVFFLIFTTLFIVFKKNKNTNLNSMYFLLSICLTGVVLFFLCTRYEWLSRISNYYFIAYVLWFPSAILCFTDNKEKAIMLLLVLIFVLSFTYVSYDLKRHGEFVPYEITSYLINPYE